MSRIEIICLVEGQGEEKAVPILMRRLFFAIRPQSPMQINVISFRVKRDKIVKAGELERAVLVAAQSTTGPCAILILLDADADCPATLAPNLLQRARAARSDRPIAVVLAQREYEAWFLAAAESLRGCCGLPETLTSAATPEAVHGAKEWLQKQMPRNRKYDAPVDQPELTRRFDLQAARACRSFDKLYRDMERLLAELEPPPDTRSDTQE